MFKLIVLLVHALIFILSTLIGLGDVMNPAAQDAVRSYDSLFLAMIIYNLLV